MSIFSFFYFGISGAQAEKSVWHKIHTPIFPKTMVDGSISNANAPLYRRWNDGKWEYRQDRETEEEFESRQV